jgi:cell wall-associated NlpC family hydrolase
MTLRLPAMAAAVVLGAVGVSGCGNSEVADPAEADRPDEVVLTPESVDKGAAKRAAKESAGKGKVVELRGAGEEKSYASGTDGVSPGAPSDAEVKADLRQARAELSKFKRFLGTTAYLQTGPKAKVLKDGTAVAPEDAPEPVKRVIQAGNAIAKFPYKWGGGHGAWKDNGYDCSGSVSFALAGAGLLRAPMTSGGFVDWGEEGPGEWITIYANNGHIFMIVAGLRFDTSGRGRAGTRWQENARGAAGFAVRHVPGL